MFATAHSYPDPIDVQLAAEFIATFNQYGDCSAPYWFVGPEEAGIRTLDEFQRRLEAWDRLGRAPVVDAKSFHELIGEERLFAGSRPPTQATWRRLILVLLAAKGQAASLDEARIYQRDFFGRSGGETRLTELYPLPAAKRSSWIYSTLASSPGLDFLTSKTSYELHCAPARKLAIASSIRHRRPRFVLFYGRDQIDDWMEIAGVRFDQSMVSGAQYAVADGIIYVATIHPNYRDKAGTNTNAYWIETGAALRKMLDL